MRARRAVRGGDAEERGAEEDEREPICVPHKDATSVRAKREKT